MNYRRGRPIDFKKGARVQEASKKPWAGTARGKLGNPEPGRMHLSALLMELMRIHKVVLLGYPRNRTAVNLRLFF